MLPSEIEKYQSQSETIHANIFQMYRILYGSKGVLEKINDLFFLRSPSRSIFQYVQMEKTCALRKIYIKNGVVCGRTYLRQLYCES